MRSRRLGRLRDETDVTYIGSAITVSLHTLAITVVDWSYLFLGNSWKLGWILLADGWNWILGEAKPAEFCVRIELFSRRGST